MEPVVEGALETPDGYWRVEVVRYSRREQRYRVTYAGGTTHDRVSLGTVQRILGPAYETLQAVAAHPATGDTETA